MPLSDDVRMVFSAQNLAGPEIERLVATLDAFEGGAGAATEAFSQLEAGAARQAQTLLSLDSAYQRVAASSEALRSVQGQITAGLLSGTAAAEAQAAAMSRLEAATASYLGAGQRAAAYAPVTTFDLSNPATYPAGTRVLTPAEQAMYNAQLVSGRARGLIGDLNETGTPTAPLERTAAGGIAAEGGLLGGIGGEMGAAVKYSAIYGGLYAAASAMAGGIGSAADLSRTEGMFAGQTNLTPAQVADLTNRMQAEIAQGGIPYSPTQELQGSYGLASVGLGGGNVAVIDAVNALTTRMSAASMAPDTSTANQALLALLQATGGLQGPDVVQRATTLANQLQAGVNVSPLAFSDFASQLPKFVGAGGQLGIKSADLIGYLSLAANAQVTPDEAGNEAVALQQSLVHPNRRAQNVLGGMGINVHDPRGVLGQLGGLVPFLERVQEATIGQGATQAQTMDALVGITGNVVAARGLTTVLTQNPNIGAAFAQFQQPGDTVGRAYSQYEATPGAQLQSAEAQFSAALTNLGTAVLPAFTTAVQDATGGLKIIASVLAGPGGKGGFGASLEGGLVTLGYLFDPTSPDFLNIEKARADAGKHYQDTVPLTAQQQQAAAAAHASHNPFADFQGRNLAITDPNAPLTGRAPLFSPSGPVAGPPMPAPTAESQAAATDALAVPHAVNAAFYALARGSGQAADTPSMHFATPAQLAAMSLAPPSGGAGSTPLGSAERDLQAQLRTAELRGDPGLSSQLAQALIAFERTNQQQLGLSSAQLGLNVAQIEHGLSRVGGATERPATGPTLIRPAQDGYTDPRAAYGQALARIAGDEGERRQLQLLEQQLTAAQKTVAQQAQQIVDDRQIINALQAIARNTAPLKSQGPSRTTPRTVSGGWPSL